MAPKINFEWSFIYENSIHRPFGIKESIEKIESEVNNHIAEIKKIWNKIEEPILKFLEEETSLNWRENKIKCYVIHTSHYLPLSDPLTIAINLNNNGKIYSLTKERFIDILIHELIHNLFIQNKKETDSYFKTISKKSYAGSNWNVNAHLIVHALHEKIFLKFFDKKRLENEINACQYYPDYGMAWDIVLKIGSDKIIDDFRISIEH